MFTNYMKIILRNIGKNKFYSILNTAGLSVGMVCFILIGLYIMHEFAYDKYHRNAKNIYRAVHENNAGLNDNTACCPAPLGPALKFEFPHIVKDTVRFFNYWGLGFGIRYEKNVFNEVKVTYCDSSVFTIFDFEMVRGNPGNALDGPYRVVITESAARKYFGKKDPMGKSLRVNDGFDAQVTGIIKDMPSKSHFHFHFLISFDTLKQLPWKHSLADWHDRFCYTYIQLRDGTSPAALYEKLPGFYKKYLPPRTQKTNSFDFQPLTGIHLESGLPDELEPRGNLAHIYILLSIAVFILTIAVINYINLSTIYYTSRIKEIGVRKVIGSQRFQLVLQFIGESAVLCFSALLFSLVIVELTLPQFSKLVGKNISLNPAAEPSILLLPVLLGFVVSLLAGAYPAFYISSFQPSKVLGKFFSQDVKRRPGRRVLVVSQLIIASFLIIGTMTIYKQLTYIDTYDVNFDKDNILILSVNQTPVSGKHYDAFIDGIKQHPGVIDGSGMRSMGGYEHIKEGFTIEGAPAEQERQMLPFLLVRHNFIHTFALEIAAGRDFSKEFPGDESEAVLINETLARELGWKNRDAAGKRLEHRGWGKLKVIGIVGDFNFESLHSTIKPLIIKLIWPRRHSSLTDYIAVRIRPGDVRNTIAAIHDTWKRFAPGSAFEYSFLDKKREQFYKSENTLSRISSIFTIIALAVSCLGLLGLIFFITESKTKELAIRKALGAPVTGIVGLISKEFVLLILIGNIIAWPIAYFAAHRWLQNFAFRTGISLWIFVLAAAITFFTSFLAVAFHTLKAANANPVDYLRHE